MMITPVQRFLSRLHSGERGQVLVMVAGLLIVLLGMAALAVDLGGYATQRRDLQNAADSAALAASQDLPDATAARAAANAWAVKNDVDTSRMRVEIIPQSASEPNPKVRVTIEDTHDFSFAKAIGIRSGEIQVVAAAVKTSASGGDGTVPLAITEASLLDVTVGDPVVLKYDANDPSNGNFGPIRIDGSGGGNCTQGNAYCDSLQSGADNPVCAVGTEAYCDGPTQVDTQPGNLTGSTRTAIQWRLDNTDSHCNEFTEVFGDDPDSSDSEVYRLKQECNPFLAGGYDSHRVMIVPVIDTLCNGSCEVTIVDFALFFLEGFGTGQCTGSECQIIGSFVRVDQSIGLLAGSFDPSSFNSFVRLVE